MKSKSALSLARINNALRYSGQGIGHAWRGEAAFRQELVGFAVLGAYTLSLHLPPMHNAVIGGAMFLVLALELVNSSIEAVVDKTCPEIHPLAGKAKDFASAAVLMGMAALAWIWCTLAGPVAWTLARAWVAHW